MLEGIEGILFASHMLTFILGILIGYLIGVVVGEHEARKEMIN